MELDERIAVPVPHAKFKTVVDSGSKDHPCERMYLPSLRQGRSEAVLKYVKERRILFCHLLYHGNVIIGMGIFIEMLLVGFGEVVAMTMMVMVLSHVWGMK